MKETREGMMQNHLIHIGIVFIMAICGIAFCCVQNVYADDIASGTCGTCDWVIDEEGTLIISEGVLEDWVGAPPWYDHGQKINNIRTEGEVVITTGAKMFESCTRLADVDLSNTIAAEGANLGRMFRLHTTTYKPSNTFINSMTIGDWSAAATLPSFPIGMRDKDTMINYLAGEDFPAVVRHHFVLCEGQVEDYLVTNIEVSQNVLEWGDTFTVTIDYIGEVPVDNVRIDFQGRIDGSFGSPPDEQTFDPDTGIGSVTIQRTIDTKMRMGEYRSTTLHLYGQQYTNALFDYAIFYDVCPITIKPPYENVIFDKGYDDPDLLDAISGLQDGEAAFVRCGTITEKELPAELEPRQGWQYEDVTYYEIKADYYNAIKGKDITLYIPLASGSQMVINGMDVQDAVKNVYVFSSHSPFYYDLRHDAAETRITDFKLLFKYPKNGSLPCKTLYRFPFYPFADEAIDLISEMNIPFSYEDIIGYLDKSSLYYLQGNTLVRDDGAIELNGDWIDVTINHNSRFIASSADPKDLRSFEATTSKAGYAYTGKTIKPSVNLYIDTDMGKDSDYAVAYSNKNSKAIGTYSITVKAQTNGYGSQTIKYKINPKGTSISSKSGKRKAFTVKWKKQSAKMPTKRITGYQIQYSTSKSNLANGKKVKVKGYTKTSKTIKSLKAKKKYYVRVRTYMTVGGTNYYSGWSGTKSVTTK